MKTLAVASIKGGTGKSTLVRHLAVAAQQAGHSVTVMDCDQQATLRDWGQDRRSPPHVVAETSTSRRYVEDAIRKIGTTGCDLLVIDTPGSWEGSYTANAVALADFVVIPCRPSGEDTGAFWVTEDKVKAAGKPYGAVVTQAPTTTSKPEIDLIHLFRESGVEVCTTAVHLRQIVANSYSNGQSVFDIPAVTESDTRAGHELYAVWCWVADQLGMKR